MFGCGKQREQTKRTSANVGDEHGQAAHVLLHGSAASARSENMHFIDIVKQGKGEYQAHMPRQGCSRATEKEQQSPIRWFSRAIRIKMAARLVAFFASLAAL